MFRGFLIGSHAIILINDEVFRGTWKGLRGLGRTWLSITALAGIIFHSFLALESSSLEIKENCILEIAHISTPSEKGLTWEKCLFPYKKKAWKT